MKKRFAVCGALVLTVMLLMSFTVNAWDNPQKYSMDSYGFDDEFWAEVEKIELPEEKKQKGISLWLNKSEVAVSRNPEIKDGTAYLPLTSLFAAAGVNVTVKGKDITFKNDSVDASGRIGSGDLTVNGKNISFEKEIKKNFWTIMIPAEMAAEILNAKIWYDEDGKTVAVTTGKMKDDGILRIINGKLYMNGEPFYEISFNKWDLCYQISSGYSKHGEWPSESNQYPAAEEALSQLHDMGFKTIRVFASTIVKDSYFKSDIQKEKNYKALDDMFDLADKYDIKINVCMGLTSIIAKGEKQADLICDPNSVSRQQCYQYIDEYVSRYKDRNCILMWEIENEGNLQADIGYAAKIPEPSAKQLGQFYADVAARIKMNDPERLVTGGDGELRGAQFNLYKGTKIGFVGCDWTQDTLEERLYVMELLYHGVDVISVHSYDAGRNDIYYAGKRTDSPDAEKTHQDLNLYMSEAKRLGKVLYNGETSLSCTSSSHDDSLFEQAQVEEYLQETIDAGVQLTHWWTYHCDRVGHEDEDMYTWDMTFGKGLEAVKIANAKLKEKYCRNGIETYQATAWEDFRKDPVESPVKEAEVSGCGGSLESESFVFVSAAAVLGAAVALRKKRED